MDTTMYWERFVLYGEENPNIRKDVLDSWNRCKSLGLSHETQDLSYQVDPYEFRKRKKHNEMLIQAALPIMQELYHCLKGGQYLLLLADAEGYLISMMADQQAQKIADQVGISPGARWMEDTVGSTGLSIALKTRAPIATTAMEHYCQAFRVWDCSACPIYVEGEFLGVFDICRIGPGNDIRELYTLAVSGAQAIIERLRYEKSLLKEEILSLLLSECSYKNSKNTGIMSFDKSGKIIYQNKTASHFLEKIKKENELLSYDFNSNRNLILTRIKHQSENEGKISLDGQEYVLKSKEIEKGGRILGTTVFVGAEEKEKKDYFLTNDNDKATFISDRFETKSPVFLHSFHIARKAAKSDACILIQGESGSGKDYIARLVHMESKRAAKPFIAINCASLPRELIATELFGYAQGAFTGAKQQGNIGKMEAANGGTLFLDEIADMPLDLQAVFLRALEEKCITRVGSSKPLPINVRFLAATHKNLKELVEKGEFRQDLYYRLNIFTLYVPPLRERTEDIELLLTKMLHESCSLAERKMVSFTPGALDILKHYLWPGNLRELRNVAERIAYLHDGEIIRESDIVRFLKDGNAEHRILSEREELKILLEKSKGNRTEAAKELNISRSALYRKLKKYGLDS